MKKVIQILKRKKIGLVIILIVLNISNSISQTNPWENTSKENPWGENPDSNLIVSHNELNYSDTLYKTDSINTENSDQITISKSSNLYLKVVDQQSRKEFKAPAAFVGSFLSSGFFLILALPVNMITSVIPTKKTNAFVADYKDENPKASTEEIKAVKRGIQKKRSLNSLGGSLAGAGTGIIVWVTSIWYMYNN